MLLLPRTYVRGFFYTKKHHLTREYDGVFACLRFRKDLDSRDYFIVMMQRVVLLLFGA